MVIFWIAVGLILNFFAFLLVLYIKVFYNNPVRHRKKSFVFKGQAMAYKENIDSLHRYLSEKDYEQIFITNRSGMKLAARYYHFSDSAPLAIMFHGYRSFAMYDAGGGFRICSEKGFNILIPDQRAHGVSEGKSIAFGVRERYDCLDWIEYAIARFGAQTRIILVGVSMGAATVLMASELDIPDNVKGIIADCGYSSPEAMIKKVIKDLRLPGFVVYPCVRLSGRLFGGFDIEEASPIGALSHLSLPVLIVHGEKDGFVPCDMARDMQKASGCDLLLIPGAGHGLSYVVDTEKYRMEAENFIKKVI